MSVFVVKFNSARSHVPARQLVKSNFEIVGKLYKLCNRRLAVTRLPVRNGLYGGIQRIGKLLLPNSPYYPQIFKTFRKIHNQDYDKYIKI